MACATLGLGAPPALPEIFLPSGIAVELTFGTVGVTCCHYTIPGARLPITIPIPAAALAIAAAAVNAAIAQAFDALDAIQIPDCPTE